MRFSIPNNVLYICQQIRAHHKRAWIVGGCVRDLLRGVEIADYDICTDARPEEIQRYFPKVIPTGIQHGTVTVLHKGEHFEVTTLRGETTYSDGRRPDQVTYVDDITEDLARRDLTINAIAFDPLHDQLIDPFGGQKDLKAGIVKAVGNPLERFQEDGLRVLRTARFAALLEAELDPATEQAIQPSLATFRKVSAERIREEWLKSMKARRPSQAFDIMRRTGILGVSCPELVESFGCEQNRYHAFDVWGHAMACLDASPKGDPILRLAALLHDVGKPRTRNFSQKTMDYTFYEHERVGAEMTLDILQRLRFSNDERDRIAHLVRHHLVCYEDSWTDAAIRRWIKRIGRENLNDMYEIVRCDALGKGKDFQDQLAMVDQLRERVDIILESGDAINVKHLQINGKDIIDHFQIKPGKIIGQVLEVLLEKVMDLPELNNREQLLLEAQTYLNAESKAPEALN
jgi:tRNA nucleotidyltransferase (CCA-adding enzyme)